MPGVLATLRQHPSRRSRPPHRHIDWPPNWSVARLILKLVPQDTHGFIMYRTLRRSTSRSLRRATHANQAILGQVTGIDRSTTTYLITRLIRKGLLQRRRTAADARAYAVNLTNEGRRELRKLGPVVKAVDKHVLASLPEARREPFLSSLRSVIETLGKSPAQR